MRIKYRERGLKLSGREIDRHTPTYFIFFVGNSSLSSFVGGRVLLAFFVGCGNKKIVEK